MHRLGAWFDWLIVDSPPVLPLADAIVWAHVIDGTLLVTRQGVTEKRQLTKGIELLKSSKLIGGLVNCSTSLSRGYYHYYHRYHRQMAASEKDGTAA
jgi:Mrp family chromosome partitioning ATPase